MSKKYLIIAIVLISILIIILIGYFVSSNKSINGKQPNITTTTVNIHPTPISPDLRTLTTTTIIPPLPDRPMPPSLRVSTETYPTITPDNNTNPNEKYKTLFKQKLYLVDIDYPKIYAYDINDFIIKYFDISDLENIQIKELYNALNSINTYNFERIFISPSKNQLIFKQGDIFTLVDIDNDLLRVLPYYVQNFVFLDNKLILYISDGKSFSYIGDFDWLNNKTNRIRNLGILNPELVSFKNGILIYEKNNPIFLLELLKKPILRLFSTINNIYALIPSVDNNFLLISYFNELTNNNQTIVMKTNNQEILESFSWITISDKCSFKEVLVCGVNDKGDFNPQAWNLLQTSNDNKLVIFNPQNSEVKEIDLDGNFDIIKPVLTPLGIIFWNRSDRLFYVIDIK